MEYKWVALSNTTIGTLMSSIDTNIVLIALPTIARDLKGMTTIDVLWVILGYQLVISSVLVNFGRLSDIFGRVKLYNAGFAIFTLGSALCSISGSAAELIAFRLIQATGSGFLFSNSAAILTDAFPVNERGRALGINQVSIVVGSVTGLILGGLLTSYIGWRSIFWVNIPIGGFATAWAYLKLRELSSKNNGERLDVMGNILFAAALVIALLAVTMHAIAGAGLFITLVLLACSAAVFYAFVRIERRSRFPMFDFSLFRNPSFTAGNEAIFLNSLSRGSFTLVMVFFLQGPIMGLTPLEAGIFLIPLSVSLSVMGPISGYLSDIFGHRILVVVGLAVSSAGFLLMTRLGGAVSEKGLLLPLILIGAGMGIFASPNRSSIMNSVPPGRRGIASGISTTLVNTGNTLSIGLAFSLMSLATPREVLDKIFSGETTLTSGFAVDSFLNSVHIVFYISTALLAVSIVIYVLEYYLAVKRGQHSQQQG
ncbi:MAG: MFS transporter [Thermoplasmataceae archaeon]